VAAVGVRGARARPGTALLVVRRVTERDRMERTPSVIYSFCGKSQTAVKKIIAGPGVLHMQRVHRSLQ
jgi:ClpX C4-type zinc finger